MFNPKNFETYYPGKTPIRAVTLNDIVRRLKRIEKFSVVPPLELISCSDNDVLSINLPSEDHFYFQNDSGEEVPEFACMKIKGGEYVDNLPMLFCTKPDSDLDIQYAFNTDCKVPAGSSSSPRFGICTINKKVFRARYDPNSSTPEKNQAWGVRPGQWELARGYPTLGIMLVPEKVNHFGWFNHRQLGMLPGRLLDPLSYRGQAIRVAIYSVLNGNTNLADTGMILKTSEWILKQGLPAPGVDKNCFIDYSGGVWYIINVECP